MPCFRSYNIKHYLIQILSNGHISSGSSSGFLLISQSMVNLKNLPNCNRNNASEGPLSCVLTCLANTLVLFNNPCNVIILMSTIQFLQFEDILFSICTTHMLSQNKHILLFLKIFSHRRTKTVTAYNSKYSILGFTVPTNVDHLPTNHDLLQIPPNPRLKFLEESVCQSKVSASTCLKSTNGL